MKTIVIPTRGCESALKLFRLGLQLYPNEPVTCWFLDIRPFPGNYNDLLMLGRTAPGHCVFDDSFREAVQSLKEQEPRVQVYTDHIFGDSPYVFRNYLKHREAGLVVYDKQEWQHSYRHSGLNIFRMVRRCDCELMYVSGDEALVHSSGDPGDHGNVATGSFPQLKPVYTKAPASVQYQFQAVNDSLAQLAGAQRQRMMAVKLNHLSRYFLKEDALQEMMVQSGCSLLLLQK